MEYIEVKFSNPRELNDIIIAYIGEIDFEMFEENESGLNAYIPASKFSEGVLQEVLSSIPDRENIRYEFSLVEDRNWNKEWESNFSPVTIDHDVYVRAPFHETREGFRYEIIIEPKMSFGTGHHETTELMMRLMLELDLKNKTILDMGCGSGILAILAHKMGAMQITAIDFDDWAYHNCLENCERNNASQIIVAKGNVSAIRLMHFDIVLANINRNVLLADMHDYVNCLRAGGLILQSGFLNDDENVLIKTAEENGLKHLKTVRKDKWSAMAFSR
ncbi:MAG: 50S ribosomal protein L11 methyltransferase [Bacteroidetes bacterium]|nr:50S ribosomal protein L11 methyltransferase [Bacteroidota bacterium]